MPEELIHPVSGKLKKLTEAEFIDLFDPSVRDAVLALAARHPDCEAIVCFENLDLSSSNLGARTALVVGPSNTYKLEDIIKPGARLGDVPSRFQYPVSYVDYRKENSHYEKD